MSACRPSPRRHMIRALSAALSLGRAPSVDRAVFQRSEPDIVDALVV